MNYSASDMRDALMIDLESDSDIAACEAAFEIAEYAMESAAFEYDGYDTTAMEAADNAILSKAEDTIKTAIRKIREFVKLAIATIRRIIPRLKMFVNKGINKFQAARAERLNDKLLGANPETAAKLDKKINPMLKQALENGIKPLPKDYVSSAMNKVIGKYEAGRPTDGSTDSMGFKARQLWSVPTLDAKDTTKGVPVTITDAKNYLDNAVTYLNSLNSATSLESEIIKNMKYSNKVAAIKNAMLNAFNTATTAVRKYYHHAMNIAQLFVNADRAYNRLDRDEGGKVNSDAEKEWKEKYSR